MPCLRLLQTRGALDQGTPISAAAPLRHHRLVPKQVSFTINCTYGQWRGVILRWVWSPNNVAPGWRPYTDGSWGILGRRVDGVFDVSWGWAPFHYGRWFFHEHRGWCWVPGSEWAPAWVAWHWGDDYCGWAPMPPLVAWETYSDWDAVIPTFGWCFVEHRDFRHRHLKDHLALVARNVTLLHATRNVTRLEVRDRTVVNLSLTAEQVEKAIGHPVRRLQIAEVSSLAEADGRVKKTTGINIYARQYGKQK